MDYSNHGVEVARSKDAVDHGHPHPNNTPATASWAPEQTLHVAAAYSNPFRWRTRLRLFNDFRRQLESLPNVKLHVGELAYGDRPFEVTCASNPLDIQLRTDHELWHKENILNVVISRFDPTWRYGAYVDGDFTFTRYDVALETIHMLQHHEWVQMFSTYCDLTHDHKPMRILKSFGSRFVSGELTDEVLRRVKSGLPASEGLYYPCGLGKKAGFNIGTTGAAWAFRRQAFNACGGLLDTCILGSGDWHMAFGIAGEPDKHEQSGVNQRYSDSIKAWQSRASRYTNRNVGVVDCHAIHHFHGSKSLRGYGTRWKILQENNFDPSVDIFKDYQGIYQLTANKPDLRDGIRAYFRSRNEDDVSLRDSDVILGD